MHCWVELKKEAQEDGCHRGGTVLLSVDQSEVFRFSYFGQPERQRHHSSLCVIILSATAAFLLNRRPPSCIELFLNVLQIALQKLGFKLG